MPDVEPKPDLADVPMKQGPSPADTDRDDTNTGTDPADPPADDVTLPTE